MLSSRISKTLMAGAFVGALAVGSVTSAQALSLPVSTAATVAGEKPVDQVRWGGWGGHRWGGWGWHHHRGFGWGGFGAGAALGLIGGLALSSAYAYPYYNCCYPAYYPTTYYYSYPAYYPAYRVRRVYYVPAYYPRRVVYFRHRFRHHHAFFAPRYHRAFFGGGHFRHHGGMMRVGHYGGMMRMGHHGGRYGRWR